MIIKELAFHAFCEVFKNQDDVLIGVGFTDHGTVDVLLTPTVTWYVIRDAETGNINICGEYEDSGEDKEISFKLRADSFQEITIC